jgi:uncharacterized protein (DUF58 family)
MQKMADNATIPNTSADAVLRRLEWTVLRRLDGLLQGDYRTLMRGAGLDLADLREYQHSDDVRHIDWNVTARLNQPHVRQFTEDRELTAWFLLDLSGSVDFGSLQRSKRAVSTDFVAVLARLLTRHGNRVGALLYGNTVDAVLPARGGRGHVLNLLKRMQDFKPPKTNASTQLASLLQAAQQIIPRRSMVFVVSDFISAPGWADAMARLSQKHEVLAVRLFDPSEMDLPDVGWMTMQDAETGEQVLVDTADAGFRDRFKALAEEAETSLRSALARAGVDTLELSTDDDLVNTLMRFTDMRRARSRLSGGASAAKSRHLPSGMHAHLQNSAGASA